VSERGAGLYERIRFNATLEALALRRLAEMDLDGCRTAFQMLLDRLDMDRVDGHGRAVVLLLLDVLQEVNRRLRRSGAFQAQRVDLVERFAACSDPGEMQRQFLPILDRMLAPWASAPSNGHPVVQQARTFIEDRYAQRLSLSIVARHLCVSANYLSRLFRRETGSTLTAFIHRVRVEHALLALASGGRNLAEIASRVGYQNYRDFYRNFVKHERVSPRQVQRKLAHGVGRSPARRAPPNEKAV